MSNATSNSEEYDNSHPAYDSLDAISTVLNKLKITSNNNCGVIQNQIWTIHGDAWKDRLCGKQR